MSLEDKLSPRSSAAANRCTIDRKKLNVKAPLAGRPSVDAHRRPISPASPTTKETQGPRSVASAPPPPGRSRDPRAREVPDEGGRSNGDLVIVRVDRDPRKGVKWLTATHRSSTRRSSADRQAAGVAPAVSRSDATRRAAVRSGRSSRRRPRGPARKAIARRPRPNQGRKGRARGQGRRCLSTHRKAPFDRAGRLQASLPAVGRYAAQRTRDSPGTPQRTGSERTQIAQRRWRASPLVGRRSAAALERTGLRRNRAETSGGPPPPPRAPPSDGLGSGIGGEGVAASPKSMDSRWRARWRGHGASRGIGAAIAKPSPEGGPSVGSTPEMSATSRRSPKRSAAADRDRHHGRDARRCSSELSGGVTSSSTTPREQRTDDREDAGRARAQLRRSPPSEEESTSPARGNC